MTPKYAEGGKKQILSHDILVYLSHFEDCLHNRCSCEGIQHPSEHNPQEDGFLNCLGFQKKLGKLMSSTSRQQHMPNGQHLFWRIRSFAVNTLCKAGSSIWYSKPQHLGKRPAPDSPHIFLKNEDVPAG